MKKLLATILALVMAIGLTTAAWADGSGDLLLVAREFGPGSLTTSGSSTWKAAPPPQRSSTQAWPPWRAANRAIVPRAAPGPWSCWSRANRPCSWRGA